MIKITSYTDLQQIRKISLRELVNYRHPSPRRVWREGLSCSSLRRSAGSAGSGGSGGVFQTSVSCTRNTTFASGDPLPPSFVCLQDRNSYVVFSRNKNVSVWEKKQAPAGALSPSTVLLRGILSVYKTKTAILSSQKIRISFSGRKKPLRARSALAPCFFVFTTYIFCLCYI